MWWLFLLALVPIIGFWYIVHSVQFWSSRGVEQSGIKVILSDIYKSILRKQPFTEAVCEFYNRFPNSRYSGFYQFISPVLLLRSPELIKELTVRNFDHFTDHRPFLPENIDRLWSQNLFSLRGQKWKEMRVLLSPVFTSSKMKFMFDLISESGEKFVKHFLKKEEEVIKIEMRDVVTRYTNDVIANTTFGFECDSLDDSENEFFLMGKEITDQGGIWQMIKILCFLMTPKVAQILDLSFFPKKATTFFDKVIRENIESREKKGVVRADMIQLLLKARSHGFEEEDAPKQDTGFATVQEVMKSQKKKVDLTDEDISAQAFVFFVGGFDTVSTLMTFMAYELALNPDIQDRLIEEVDETREKNSKLTYEALTHMKYLDMVVSESLRKWPPFAGVDRICTKPYTIEPKLPNEKAVHLEKDSFIWVPIMGLHRDPQYYPNPERFDPERFNDENKHKINPYAYVPFGFGARNCIGSRFALLETKTLFFYILSHFKIVPIEKTPIPLKLDPNQFNPRALGGYWLGLQKRTSS